MKQNKLRILSLFLIFALCLGLLSACGGGDAKRTSDGQLRLDSISENAAATESYVSSRLELLEENISIDRAFPYKDGFLISGLISYKTPFIYYCNLDGSKVSSFDTNWIDAEQSIRGIGADEDGTLYAIISTYKNKEFVAYSLYRFSETEEAKLAADLPFDENMSIWDMVMANGELYLKCTEYPAQKHSVIVCSLQGEIIEKKDAGDYFEFASDGKNVFLSVRSPDGVTLCRYERAENALSKIEKFNSCRLLSVNENTVYLGDETSILSYDVSSGSISRIFDWLDAGIMPVYGRLFAMKNGDIFIWSSDKAAIVLLKKGAEPQTKKQDVVIAVERGLGEFTEVVINFNESSTKYHVKLVDYSSHQDPGMKLATEFVSSNAPDIVDISVFSGDISGEKNFEDLTKYFDNDPDISQEDLLPAPLAAMKSADGKLFGISPSFGIWTFLTTGENAPEKDFSSVTESLKAMGSPNEAFCGTFLRDWFLALAFSCCGADAYSEEDIALILEYAKELPTEHSYVDTRRNIAEGKQKYMGTSLSHPFSWFSLSHEFFGENPEDMVLFGMPFRAEKGVIVPSCTLGIPRSANNKEGAWEFIKFLLLSEKDGCLFSNYCPVLKAGYEKRAEVLREGVDNGTACVNEIMITDYSCFDMFDALLNVPCVAYDSGSKAFEIVVSNAEPYFAGHITAQKAAADIVSTLKIYYSEQG